VSCTSCWIPLIVFRRWVLLVLLDAGFVRCCDADCIAGMALLVLFFWAAYLSSFGSLQPLYNHYFRTLGHPRAEHGHAMDQHGLLPRWRPCSCSFSFFLHFFLLLALSRRSRPLENELPFPRYPSPRRLNKKLALALDLARC
jgi:hypothetical protein